MNENFHLVGTMSARGAPSIRSAMKVIGETRLFIRIENETLEAFRRFSNALMRAMAKLYRAETGRRPPGSERTARLRKKRQMELLKWWEQREPTFPSAGRLRGSFAAGFGGSPGGELRR